MILSCFLIFLNIIESMGIENTIPKREVCVGLKMLRNNNKCYFFDFVKNMSWNDAVYYCGFLGMRLVSINDEQELGFISKYVSSSVGQTMDFWSSGNEMADLGKIKTGTDKRKARFTWFSGLDVPEHSPMWSDHDPDFLYDPKEFQCLQLVGAKNYKLHATPCTNYSSKVICEKSMCNC